MAPNTPPTTNEQDSDAKIEAETRSSRPRLRVSIGIFV